ncbi:XRE family transcriptional regulator [Herbiconiux sp. KACC 21604]|uniref:helix-turn-helix domain-containing protein n=1 Tax=unclassified Herbiconiux TaxID=2618217 RepID=UPI0014927CF0|nr:XRE family transcriptional regulator [Herbiconiux sp. SALV-R1]QJU55607.1 helix-turn-helix transcriptional regulator [Herbiconiux sp. SALV-R1]WPO86803.1 XRE family transcriptional regulator [Herbiconiux sp. KACC 21604]
MSPSTPRDPDADAAKRPAAPGVGERIREARQAEGISLRELGSRVGVSASFLSQVELGRAMPSMGTLWTIVSELDLSFDALLGTVAPGPGAGASGVGAAAASGVNGVGSSPAPSPGFERLTTVGLPGLRRADTAPDIRIGGVRWERLTPGDDPLVEFVRVTYSPGSESSPADNMMRHTGLEYMHVMSGQMDIQVGFDSDTVQPGDSLTFDASIPHRIVNPYDVPCVSIWAVVGRHGFAPPHEIARRLAEYGTPASTMHFGGGHHSGE